MLMNNYAATGPTKISSLIDLHNTQSRSEAKLEFTLKEPKSTKVADETYEDIIHKIDREMAS